MNYKERRAEGRLLCDELSGHTAGLAPRGIHRWDLLKKFVDPPGVEFVLALSEWEHRPSPETQSRLGDAYAEVLRAWRRAAAEFCAERSTL